MESMLYMFKNIEENMNIKKRNGKHKDDKHYFKRWKKYAK